MKYFRISEEQIKNLLAYLSEKPFKEVSAGIYDLSRLEELPEKTEAPPVEKKDKK